MNLITFIYFAQIADDIKTLFAMLSVIILSWVGFKSAIENKLTQTYLIPLVILPCFILSFIFPNSKTIYLMAGASLTQNTIEEFSPELSKTRELLNIKLDEMLEEKKETNN